MSGGCKKKVLKNLKSVEVYNYYENKRTYLPDMNEGRCEHASISMSNKMFAISG